MTGTTLKLLPHRHKTAFALLCFSSIASANAITTTNLILKAPPTFDTNEAGSKTAVLETTQGTVLLDLTRKLGKGEQILAQAKAGNCLSIETKEPLFVKDRAMTDHVLWSVSPCKNITTQHSPH